MAEVVASYSAASAPCMSVVTGKWFGGHDDMLREVASLTDVPLLKKDFITRERQIADAKEMGASAILLTAQILPKPTLPKLIELTLEHDTMLAAYLLEQKGIAMRRSRIDEILRAEGLRWRRHETWFGARVDPEFAEKRGGSRRSTPRHPRAA